MPEEPQLQSFAEFKSWRSRLHLSPPHDTSSRCSPHHSNPTITRNACSGVNLQFRLPKIAIAHVRIKNPANPQTIPFPFPHILSITWVTSPKFSPASPASTIPPASASVVRSMLFQRVKLLLQ